MGKQVLKCMEDYRRGLQEVGRGHLGGCGEQDGQRSRWRRDVCVSVQGHAYITPALSLGVSWAMEGTKQVGRIGACPGEWPWGRESCD